MRGAAHVNHGKALGLEQVAELASGIIPKEIEEEGEIPAKWRHLWPAGPGEQHEWEPPRIATGVKDRVARLKALGNAVVPQQVYPILKAIYEKEREE